MKLPRLIVLTLISFLLSELVICQEVANKNQNEINVVHGQNHTFTIETPNGWINDKELAKQFGLVCFFYPLNDSISDFKNYMYALGIDKKSADETLEDFIKLDLKKFDTNYPDFKFDTIKVENTGGVINSKFYSFYNLSDRYKEEVLYSETDSSFIILSFAAKEKLDYDLYFPAFEFFVGSFNYRGNNPNSFLEYLSKSKTD